MPKQPNKPFMVTIWYRGDTEGRDCLNFSGEKPPRRYSYQQALRCLNSWKSYVGCVKGVLSLEGEILVEWERNGDEHPKSIIVKYDTLPKVSKTQLEILYKMLAGKPLKADYRCKDGQDLPLALAWISTKPGNTYDCEYNVLVSSVEKLLELQLIEEVGRSKSERYDSCAGEDYYTITYQLTIHGKRVVEDAYPFAYEVLAQKKWDVEVTSNG